MTHYRPPEPGEVPRVSIWKPVYDGRGRSRWHWLLLIPIVVPLIPALYDRTEPRLLGVPFFYWSQMAFVPLCVAVITAVERASRKRD